MIDNGSGFVKAGFSGEDEPRCIFPSIIGRPNNKPLIGIEGKEEYYGDDAQRLRGILKISYPIEHGLIKDWDDME